MVKDGSGFAIWLVLFVIVLSAQTVQAKDLGVHGHLYTISEQDFLEFIQARLGQLQQSGEFKQLQLTWQKQAQEKAIRPQPVKGLSTTTDERTWVIDPSITLSTDLEDHMGNTIIPAGNQFNPLNRVSLRQPLVFFNSDDEAQCDWVKNMLGEQQQKFKLILVQGNISETATYFEQSIYFDQAGKLIAYFQIKHIPAIVTQKGDTLEVREVIP